jgi:hypothetical protein
MVAPNYSFQKRQKELEKKRKKEEKLKRKADDKTSEPGDTVDAEQDSVEGGEPPATPESASSGS